MKIYDSSGDDDGMTSTKSRNKVSFLHSPISDKNRTPGRGGSARRTPFRQHNHQRSDSSPMHAFRKSLHGDTLQKPSTRKSTRTSQLNDKENQPTPGSAQAFRRSLRATVTSQPTTTTTTTSTNGMAIAGRRFRTSLGPPQRVQVPFTSPGSLLRTELTDEDLEESLLVSPPGALWNVLNTSSTGLVIVSPQAAEHINQTWSEQKQKMETDTMFSPARPRMLLSGQTPIATNNAKKHLPSSLDETCMEGTQEDLSSEQQLTGQVELERKDKGVSMDMTMMFSDPQKDTSSKKSGQPSNLIKRLSAKRTGESEIKDSTTKSTKGENQNPLSFVTSNEARSLQQPKRQVSTKPVLPKPSVSKNNLPAVSSVSETPKRDNGLHLEWAAPKNTETPGGLCMDMSDLFGKESSSRGSRAPPPSNLIARLSRSKKTATSRRLEGPKGSTSSKCKPAILPRNKTKTQIHKDDTRGSNSLDNFSSRKDENRNEIKVNATEMLTTKFSELKQKVTSRSRLATPCSRAGAKLFIAATSDKPNNLTSNKAVDARMPTASTQSNQKTKNEAAESALVCMTTSANKKKAGYSSTFHSITRVVANDESSSKLMNVPPARLHSRLSKPTKNSLQKTSNINVQLETSKTTQERTTSSLFAESDGKRSSRRVLSPTDAIKKNQQLSIGKPSRVSPKGSIKATQTISNEKEHFEMRIKPNKENASIVSQKEIAKQTMAKIVSKSAASTASRGTTTLEKKPNSVCAPNAKPLQKKQTQTTPKASNLALSRRSPQKLNASKPGGTWADKQCSSFVAWLDFILNPVDEDDDESKIDTDTRINMRALLMHRRLAKVRFQASELFHGEDMRKIKTIIHGEIFKGRLSIRTDRELHADLGLRKELISLLLSYTTPWLRLGLEVFFGECIEPEQATSDDIPEHMTHLARMRTALRKFIVDRVLSDPGVLAKYTKGRCKVPSGKFEKQYNAEMRVLVLYRIMVIIFFLDRAKVANVLDKVPRLFGKGAAVKSSKAVLLAVCRDFLSSEGDFIKHLSRIGLTVSYTQEAVDELDYRVSNIATDLRDGVRLTKMAEILTEVPMKSLLSVLRVPAVSRLQKLHNVKVALIRLKDFGILIPEDVIAHHIVDGHREMNLKLIWAVIAHCCLSKLLDNNMVEEEIGNVLRSNHSRRKVHGRTAEILDQDVVEPMSPNHAPEDRMKSLLLRWCRAVCSSFGVDVSDFSDSFADGRAICLLIHYYHPSVIKRDEILPTSKSDSETLPLEQAIVNERANSTIASRRVAELGGIPKMIPVSDSENPPDEKSMMLCLSFMCSRLMESSKEIFAAILIQASYRNHRYKELQKKKVAAAKVILLGWREFKSNYFRAQKLRYSNAVAVLEDFALSRKRQLLRLKENRLRVERKLAATVLIQTYFRGLQERKKFRRMLGMHFAAIAIQNTFKMFIAKTYLLNLRLRRRSCILIQNAWRQKRVQKAYIHTLLATVRIQKVVRGFLARNERGKLDVAAMIIQKAWWSFVIYWEAQTAANTIQRSWRSCIARHQASLLVSRRDAACTIQKVWRGHYRYTQFSIFLQSTMALQKVVRGYLSRKVVSSHRCTLAAVAIQSAWRSFSAQIRFEMELLDIIAVQAQFRAKKARSERNERTRSVVIIQNAIRYALARRCYSFLVEERRVQNQREIAAVTCQSAVRCWFSRLQLNLRNNQKVAATGIQRYWRGYCCKNNFNHLVASNMVIQAVVRGYLARREVDKRHFAARIIQSNWRCFWAKFNFNLDVLEIIITQSAVRRYIAVQQSLRRRAAVEKIQKAVRRYQAAIYLERLRLEELEFSILEGTAVIIQSFIRRRQAQGLRRRAVSGMLTLQSLCRGKQARAHFTAIKAAVTCIQAAFRGKKQRQLCLVSSRMATRIQCQWRRFSARVKYFVFLADVIVVQSTVRRYQSEKFTAKKMASILIVQTATRKWIANRYVTSLRCEKAAENFASITIQSMYRAKYARELFHTKRSSTIALQKAFRQKIAREKFASIKSQIIIMQSFTRQRLAMMQFVKLKASILSIQSAVRRMIARGKLRHLQTKKLALLLQRYARGFLARKVMRSFRRQATVIQSAFRAHYARLCYEMDVMDIVLAQSVVRRWLVGKSLVMKARAAVTIQNLFRKKRATTLSLLLRFGNQRKQDEIHSATLVQSYWRGHASRMVSQQHSAARKIQKTWRCFIAHVDFLIQVMSAIKIQSKMRQRLTVRAIEVERRAAVKLQADVRCRVERRNYLVVRASAAKIQSIFRAYLVRGKKAASTEAAVTIQRCTRGHLCRVDLHLANFAASDIQRVWRGYTCYIDFALKSIVIVSIQAQVRRFLATRTFQALKLESWADRRYLCKKASLIQNCFRCFRHRKTLERSATKIQAVFKVFLQQRQARKFRRGIIKFQAQTRAIAVRRQRPKKMVALARRVSFANEKSSKDPKMRLGYRTKHALAVLRKSNSLTEIMAAVKTLEAATRLSYVCCEVFTGVNAAHILLNLIVSCNRSVPHVQLVLSTLLTLDNVARYPRLLPSFADCGAAEIFQDKMQMFRDNDNIFCLSVSLLGCIAECNPAVKELCAVHEHLKRLKSVHQMSIKRAKTNKRKAEKLDETVMNGRRDTFDMIKAVKSLGKMIKSFEQLVPAGEKHFTF